MTNCLLAASSLSVTAEGAGVVALPCSSLRWSQLHRADTLVVETASLATSRCETTTLTALHDGVAYPVDLRIIADPWMERINKDDFVPFVRSVLSNPVGIQDAERGKATPNFLFSKRSQRATRLQADNTDVPRFTVRDAMDTLALTSTATYTHAINNIATLGFVTKAVSLFGTSRMAAALDRVHLTVLPCTETEEVVEGFRLLLAP